MSELEELYREIILDHNKTPRNFHEMPEANRQLEGYNPLCGDKLTVYLNVDGDLLKDINRLGGDLERVGLIPKRLNPGLFTL